MLFCYFLSIIPYNMRKKLLTCDKHKWRQWRKDRDCDNRENGLYRGITATQFVSFHPPNTLIQVKPSPSLLLHWVRAAVAYDGHVPIWKVLIRVFIPPISVRAPQAVNKRDRQTKGLCAHSWFRVSSEPGFHNRVENWRKSEDFSWRQQFLWQVLTPHIKKSTWGRAGLITQ